MARLRGESAQSSVFDRFSSAAGSTTPDPPRRRGTQATLSPSPSASSDKENQDTPEAQSARTNKGKGMMAPPPRPMLSEQRGNKRRRLGEAGSRSQSVMSEDDRSTRHSTVADNASSYNGEDTLYYDPEQDEDERRRVRSKMRDNVRNLNDRKNELLASNGNEFVLLLNDQDAAYKGVRQTSDATIDSRFLVAASDLALRKAKSGGDNTAGVDIDEFVSKCISFMRNGGRPTRHSAEREGREQDDDEAPRSTQRHTSNNRRTSRHVDDDEEADEDGDALPWHIFGARAAFPCNKRPPVPSFLLGPLSVQKRVRAQTQRTQRTARNAPQEPVSRPQELRAEDFATQENNNLTALCKKIHNRLMEVEDVGKVAVDEVFQPHNNLTEEEAEQAALAKCKEMHLAMNPEDNEPGVPLFEFAIHPTSFGQSVENLFYVSFLIRDGHAMLFYDEHKLPVLRAIREQRSIEESRRENVKKRQAIISLDYPSWRQLIDVFDITKPLIPHREPQVQDVGRAGWYG